MTKGKHHVTSSAIRKGNWQASFWEPHSTGTEGNALYLTNICEQHSCHIADPSVTSECNLKNLTEPWSSWVTSLLFPSNTSCQQTPCSLHTQPYCLSVLPMLHGLSSSHSVFLELFSSGSFLSLVISLNKCPCFRDAIGSFLLVL